MFPQQKRYEKFLFSSFFFNIVLLCCLKKCGLLVTYSILEYLLFASYPIWIKHLTKIRTLYCAIALISVLLISSVKFVFMHILS